MGRCCWWYWSLSVPIAWRRSHPVVVALVVCSAHLAASAMATGPFPPQLAILPVLVVIYTASSLTRAAGRSRPRC